MYDIAHEYFSELSDGPLENGVGGGKTKKKISSQKKIRKKNLSRHIVQKKIPCLEDRPINFT
jgi:hypothetical protein